MFAINQKKAVLDFLRWDRKNVRVKIRGCICATLASEKEANGAELAIIADGGEKYFLTGSRRKQRLLEHYRNKRVILNGLINFNEKLVVPLSWKPVDPHKPNLTKKDTTWTGVVIHLKNFRDGSPMLRGCANF